MIDDVLTARCLLHAADHAARDWPRESCGAILDGGVYRADANLSETPEVDSVHHLDGTERVVVHSHTMGNPWPSPADMRAQIQTGVPHLIVTLEFAPGEPDPGPIMDGRRAGGGFTLVAQGPAAHQLPHEPWTGRPWLWGVYDCWQLVADWLRLETPVEPPCAVYGWKERRGVNLLWLARLCGWPQVDLLDIRRGDVVLLSPRSDPQRHHLGVVTADNEMLLHPGSPLGAYTCTALSRRDRLSRWWRHIAAAVRPIGDHSSRVIDLAAAGLHGATWLT